MKEREELLVKTLFRISRSQQVPGAEPGGVNMEIYLEGKYIIGGLYSYISPNIISKRFLREPIKWIYDEKQEEEQKKELEKKLRKQGEEERAKYENAGVEVLDV